jgi:hypothetical protein
MNRRTAALAGSAPASADCIAQRLVRGARQPHDGFGVSLSARILAADSGVC